jgi:ribosome-associated translation inhibitor RaiA
MTTIADTFQALFDLQERIANENASTSEDIARAEATVALTHKNLTANIKAAHLAMQTAIDDAFGQVLRDLQSIRELRSTALLDAIGPVPPVIENAAQPQLQAAE